MGTWIDDPALRERVQLHLHWFDRQHDGILGIGLGDPASSRLRPVSDAQLKAAVKRAKYLLGYPDLRIVWATWSASPQTFIDRLHHPGPRSYGMPAAWAQRGRRRRDAAKEAHSATRISARGVRLVANFEGFRSCPYIDPAGVWTIGYGHTGPGTRTMRCLARTQAADLLDRDLDRYEAAVRRTIRVPLTQGQFDALTSFAYNCGEGALAHSTLAAKLNRRNYAGAAAEFDEWVRGGGRVLLGLVRRRNAEEDLFRGSA